MSIDDLIDEWHDSDSELQLHEYLGWSEEDYRKWVYDPNFRGATMLATFTKE